MTDFIRTQFSARLIAKDNPDIVIYPQSVLAIYRINTVPVARIDLAFGQGFGDAGSTSVDGDLEQLEEWASNREMLQVIVNREISRTGSAATETFDEVIFEGRVFVPSLQLLLRGASKSFQLQHWTGDLLLGSMLVSYALPGHAQQRNVAGLYKRSFIGGAGAVGNQSQLQMEGVAYRLGLPSNWQNQVADDIWANAQKPILAALAEKEFSSPMADVFDQCKDSINSPAQRAIDALERIQGPSTTLGTPYSTDVKPLAVRSTLATGTRELLSRGIAKSIGYAPIGFYAGQNFWQKIMGFCAEFGVIFVPRPTDAAIIPFNVGMNQFYDLDEEETDIQEVAWSAFQQSSVRGIGILSTFHSNIGAAAFQSDDTRVLPHGCYLASSDPDRGMVYFTSPPQWLADVPPDNVMSLAAKGSRQSIGIHNLPTNDAPPAAIQQQGQFSTDMQDLYDQYAKLRYLESELRGRTIQLGSRFRTDIAPGTMLRVRLRPDQLISRLNLNTESLVGMVTGMTLSVSRPKRQGVLSMQMDYGRKEEQVDQPEYSVDNHPIFENDVPGLPLVE